MIISAIIGGLGNQMFQYAMGRSLSIKCASSLHLDISEFEYYKLHQGFELRRVFNLAIPVATETDIQRVLGWQSLPGVKKFLRLSEFSVLRRKEFISEPHFHYWAEVSDIPSSCYLAGYWQSEKYFQSHISAIRSDFTFAQPLLGQNADIAREISGVCAVSLHVRRGDYVSNSITKATHGVCSVDYYRAAIRHFSTNVLNPVFFIFSDDIQWVKDNLKLESTCRYIDHNTGTDSFNDMRLMSLCAHHIIANSSFSWWGAWLNPSPQKIVIAPQKWFASKVDTRDLIPDSWILL